MSEWQLTAPAEDDLFNIWSYVTRNNPEAANRIERAIFRACDLLSKSPLAGSIREYLTIRSVRFWVVQPYSNYLLVYDPATKPVQILRIVHAARDLRSELR
jgi:plasmid stabilization system protein ParE